MIFFGSLYAKSYHDVMSKCGFCEKLLTLATNNGVCHDACDKMYLNRARNNKCVYCGDPKMPSSSSSNCGKCKGGNAIYKGYPEF